MVDAAASGSTISKVVQRRTSGCSALRATGGPTTSAEWVPNKGIPSLVCAERLRPVEVGVLYVGVWVFVSVFSGTIPPAFNDM